MNLMSIIKEKSKASFSSKYYPSIEAVIHHMEIAELHMEMAKSHGDCYYADTIYRSNQAFDAALGLAYQLLAGKDPKECSTHELCEYFSKHSILKEPVHSQMKSYCDNWRSKVTYDRQHFFSAQEAFLAVVVMASFFNVLLDVILERIAYENSRSELSKNPYSQVNEISNYEELTFMQQTVELLSKFTESLLQDLKSSENGVSESEVIGKLAGFAATLDPAINIETDRSITTGLSAGRIDMCLNKNGQNVILEFKDASNNPIRRAKEGREKIKNYMLVSGVDNGLVYVTPSNSNSVMKLSNDTFSVDGRTLNTVVLYPVVPIG